MCASVQMSCMHAIPTYPWPHNMATISRLLKIIGLFCQRALLKRLYSAKVTCNFKEPTNGSHLISMIIWPHYHIPWVTVWKSVSISKIMEFAPILARGLPPLHPQTHPPPPLSPPSSRRDYRLQNEYWDTHAQATRPMLRPTILVCVYVSVCVCACVCEGEGERECEREKRRERAHARPAMLVCVYVSECVCVCVCEGKRGRESEQDKGRERARARERERRERVFVCVFVCIHTYAYTYTYIYIQICFVV